jgi:hypothetical protein
VITLSSEGLMTSKVLPSVALTNSLLMNLGRGVSKLIVNREANDFESSDRSDLIGGDPMLGRS